MGAHRRRIQEHSARSGERLGVQIFPQPRPDSACFPTPEAHVDRMPVAQFGRQIPPRTARALEMQHRFEKFPVTEFAWGSRFRMFGLFQGTLQFQPHLIADDFAHG